MHSEFRGLRVPGAHVWVLAALALGSLCAPTCGYAQQGGQTSSTPPLTGSVAPMGNCGVGSLYVNTTTGDLYDCNAGSWLKVNGGGSGAFSGGLGSSYQDATEIAAPANPAAGNDRLYLNSSTHLLACLTSGGANCMPAGGAGTVTQVTSGNFSPLFNVSVATNTTTPAFSFTGISQTQNLFFASPNGSSGIGAFRAMVAADIPASANSCATHQFTISLASGLSVTCAQPVAADIGSIPGSSGQLLYNNAGAIGAEDPIVSANQPAATTQTITATGALASVTVTNLGKVLVTVSGTYAGVAFNFEASPDGTFSPAFPVTASQVDAIATGTTSGTLPGNQTRSWFVNVEGHTKFRLNATAYTSGTANVTITPVYFQSGDASNVNIANTPSVSGSGNFTVVQPTGSNLHTVTDSGSVTNATLQASAGTDIGKLDANQSVNEAQINGHTTAECGLNGCHAVGGATADGSAPTTDPVPIAGKGAAGVNRVPVVCDNWAPFSLASTTALKIITLVSGKLIYICSINIVAAGANNVALVDGTKTTTDCDTATHGLAGGTTAATGWNFAANGGLTQGSGIGVLTATVTVSHDVCLFASAATQVSGVVSWTDF